MSTRRPRNSMRQQPIVWLSLILGGAAVIFLTLLIIVAGAAILLLWSRKPAAGPALVSSGSSSSANSISTGRERFVGTWDARTPGGGSIVLELRRDGTLKLVAARDNGRGVHSGTGTWELLSGAGDQ